MGELVGLARLMQPCWKPADLVKNSTLRGLSVLGAGPAERERDAAANAAAAAATVFIACRRVMPSEHVHMRMLLSPR